MSKSVQIIRDNYDIKNNPAVKAKYPTLYSEVVKHDLDSHSSWYSFSDAAAAEHSAYLSDKEIPYWN